MKKYFRSPNTSMIYSSIVVFLSAMLCVPCIILAHGPGAPDMSGPPMSGPYMHGQQMPGPGMGMGLQRGICNQPGAGMNLQRGIAQDYPYCRMLLDRPDLNLTPQQKEAIKKLQINYVKETFDLRSDLQINKIELKKLRFSKNPDFKTIKEKLEKISKMQLELQKKRAKLQIEADKILTDEQKDLLYLSPGMSVDIEWEDDMDENMGSGEDTAE